MKKILLLTILSLSLLFIHSYSNGQDLLKDLSLKIDTATFSLRKNMVRYQNQDYLYIKVDRNRETAEIEIRTNDSLDRVRLVPSPFISVTDTLQRMNDRQWNGLIRFEHLINNKNPSLTILMTAQGVTSEFTCRILPVFETTLNYQDVMLDIYQEEEKLLEIPSRNSYNIITDNLWYVTEDYDYKTAYSSGILSVILKPHTLGNKQVTIHLKTIKPVFNEAGQLTHDLPPLRIRFNVRPNNLYFLNTDKAVIYSDPNFRSMEELMIDYNKNMSLKKTYRIEDGPEENSNLIAELTPVSIIENNAKVLCRIRPYSLHKINDGYLYIKEEGRARFITNFNIWERPKITTVFIRREGEEWITGNNVYPGERVEVRIEGKGLENAQVLFTGLTDVEKDTLRISDEAIYFHVRIPVSVSSKTIPLVLNRKTTSFELSVKEYQKPAQLDFVYVNYGRENIPLTSEKLNKPIFYEDALNDINFLFNPSKIDENNELYGKQYLSVKVKIFNRKNDLIELQDIDNIVVCAGDNSPRKFYYNHQDCRQDAISLNDFLIHKTYRLEPFSQIEITVSHNEYKYGAKGYSKKIKLILTRKVHFDVQVTFPAGLLVKRFDEPGYGNLTGISTSILAQFNFYNPRLIGQLKPYNIGAGFIALNAFNFSTSSNNLRDVGIVILGSITPVRREAKFSLPIYAGGGYLLKADSWFVMFGPGIQLNF